MVNKKKKSRQPGPDEQNASDSTESCEEGQAEMAGAKCPHIQRAVDLNRVKKALKMGGIARKCGECERAPLAEAESEEAKEAVSSPPPSTGGLWLCLRCGHQACGRDVRGHAQLHFAVPRSDCHALSLGAELQRVWCYACNAEVPVAAKKKLLECVEFVARQEDAPVTPPIVAAAVRTGKEEEGKEGGRSASRAIVTGSVAGAESPLKDLPRLRGLRNNGNTCFFNAVLQCLAHTPYLLEVLTESREPGETFTLPGRPDDGDDPLPAIAGCLPGWGVLTETLADTLSGLRSGAADALNPAPLMDRLSQRCPLFEGGDQHDAQELLRHLLEGVRAEDLKRYQSGILVELGLSSRKVAEAADEETKARVKSYGRQAAERRLRPDQVFRGTLVSTLECQDCMHASQRPETFLDLSLPITADKPQPPVVTRRKSEEDASLSSSSSAATSKHQLKREKKAARKGAKRNSGARGKRNSGGDGTEATIHEEKHSSVSGDESGSAEPSDADVEDNLEADAVVPAESGYSSAKAGDSPPLPASPPPPQLLLAGDSALPSPSPPPLARNLQANVGGNGLTAHGDHARRSPEASDGEDEVLFERCPSPGNANGPGLSAAALGQQLASLRDQALMERGRGGATGSLSPASSEANLDMSHLDASPLHTLTRPLDDASPPDLEEGERPGSRFAFVSAGGAAAARKLDLSHEELADTSANGGGGGGLVSEEEVNHLIKELSQQTLDVSGDLPPLDEIDELIGPAARPMASAADVDWPMAGEEAEPIALGWPTPPAMPSPTQPMARLPTCLEPRRTNSPDTNGMQEETQPRERWGGTLAAKLTTRDGECSVMSCLNQFTAVELMTGNNRVGCEACTRRHNHGKAEGGKLVTTNSTKQFLVSAPPPVLILHLKRFQLQRSMLRKMALHVAFPPLLDLASLISSQDSAAAGSDPSLSGSGSGTVSGVPGSGRRRVLYALYGVVEHSGAMQYGHYVAYVKVRAPVPRQHPRWTFLQDEGASPPSVPPAPADAHAPPGKWFYVSDSRVNEVSEERVLRAEAYLLFYERIC